MEKIIFYKPSSCTHYKSLLNDKVFDPYDYFFINQKKHKDFVKCSLILLL